jgi:hypothetical protein
LNFYEGVLGVGTIRHYFAGGNTARGFYSLYDSNLKGLDRLFILKGGPGTGKSSLMKRVGEYWNQEGYYVEYLHCSSDNDSIDGILIPALKVGIVDGTAPHVIEPHVPGVIEEYVNLGEGWDAALLRESKESIKELTAKVSQTFETAYSVFAEALAVHDEWEEIFINNMDFSKADELTNELIEKLYGDVCLNKQSDVRDRFLGAATPIGAVDFIPNLTGELPHRYYIKGRPGSGKSTMLKKLAKEAETRGLDVEIYHCGFDPHSIDMVIVRELGWAIFDSTSPHEYFPERDGDTTIDVYERAITPGTDEKYETQIKDISARYKGKMNEAISYLAKAKALRDELEAFYIKAMSFDVVDSKKSEIQEEIKGIAEKLN